jgi:hypothetical protein
MKKDYVYVVRSAPVTGREDEYNLWYTGKHLQDVLAVPGFVSAQRFKLTDPAVEGGPTQPYLALYTMHTDDPDALLATLVDLVESGRIEMTDAFDQEVVSSVLYQAITPLIVPA